jgi:hypothetical protein
MVNFDILHVLASEGIVVGRYLLDIGICFHFLVGRAFQSRLV